VAAYVGDGRRLEDFAEDSQGYLGDS